MTKPWQVLNRQLLVDAHPWIALWVEQVKLPSGVVIDDYFGLYLPSWVAVFAVTDDGRVPLVEQYRHGVGRSILELPAGFVDEGEQPLDSARRELREEVGCEAASFKALESYAILPERSEMTMHAVLARGVKQVGVQQLEATEAITIHWLALDDLREAWGAGQIGSAPHALAVAKGLAALDAL